MPEENARTLDLHGLTWPEAQAAFVEFYNRALRRAGGKALGRLDVVHGYGSSGSGGVLRTRLRDFLERNKAFLEFQAGEGWDGNPGHTFVTPMQPLPSKDGGLEEEIWAYCVTPRPMSKIAGKFRRHGNSEVARAIRSLEKQQRLSSVSKGAIKLYHAAGPG